MARTPKAQYEGEGDIEVPSAHVDPAQHAARLERERERAARQDEPDRAQRLDEHPEMAHTPEETTFELVEDLARVNGDPTPTQANQIYVALSQCWPVPKIVAAFSKEWHVSAHAMKRFVAVVQEEMRKEAEEQRAHYADRLSAAVESHYAECMNAARETEQQGVRARSADGKIVERLVARPTPQRAALLAAAGHDLDRLAKLHGCYVEKVEHSGRGGGPVQLDGDVKIDLSSLTDAGLDVLDTIAAKIPRVPLALLTGGKSSGGDAR